MKKTLLTLCAVTLCLVGMAQVNTLRNAPQGENAYVKPLSTKTGPDWTPISQHVTGTNFLNSSETISTQALANSGKAMVIDFSATWCSWCWVMHTSGILEAIQSQLGSQVQCIWVEADASTSSAGLTGGSGSQGNWTQYNGSQVNYPIIDDPAFANIIGGASAIQGFPTVVLVSPSGYWCSLYGESWGFGPYSASDAVTAISTLLTQMPQANVPPVVSISGRNRTMVGSPVTFTSSIVSVEDVTNISWTATGGTPSTGSGESFTTTFATAGTYTVTLSVTNTIGTTTEQATITVMDSWNWGDEISYCGNDDRVSSIGTGGSVYWGIMIPSQYLTGRVCLDQVSFYSTVANDYDVLIYSGGTDSPAGTPIYQSTYNVTQTDQWVNLPIHGGVSINAEQNLWVVLHTNGGYPAAYSEFCGDYNGSWVSTNGSTWNRIMDVADFQSTWMIKARTSATMPDFSFDINGATTLLEGVAGTFSIAGDQSATYNWTLAGATPATATGTSVSATWSTPGNYTISVNATRGTQTASKTLNITIRSCAVSALPWEEGFEAGIDCWTFYDADGDGYGWVDGGANFTPRNGNGMASSASFINSVGPVNPDNWMVSPQITIPAEGATLIWYDYAQDANDYAENYSVYFSATGNQPSNFNTPLYTKTIESARTWKRREVNIPGGQSGYIAFRHYNCTNMYWLHIDDIQLTAGQNAAIGDVNGVAVRVYPNPATEVLNVHAEALREVSLIDVNGRVVRTSKTHEVNVSDLATGVYFVRVITDNGTAMEKIVKE